MGGCMAPDKITVDGEPVDFMYRVEPNFERDSGWRFLSGTEDQEYVNMLITGQFMTSTQLQTMIRRSLNI